MRKKIKSMLWHVAGMSSAITAVLALVVLLVVQVSMQGAGFYGKASLAEDFGVIEGNEWVQNTQGHWVANENANPSSYKGDMSSFMVIGDSISFGYMAGYVDETTGQPIPEVDQRLQVNSWPKLVADQAGVNMNLPLIDLFSNPQSPTYPRTNFGVLADNVAVPGYALVHTLTPVTQVANNLSLAVMGDYIYAGYGVNSQLGYVLARDARTVGVMIGNNDILGAATRANLALKTPVSYFDQMYSGMVAQLAADPTRSIVVATIPDVAAVPFLVPADEFAANVGVPAAYLPAYNENGTQYALSSTDYVSLAGYGRLQAGQPLVKCSNLTYSCNGQILTQAEVDDISAHAAAFNASIRSIAAQYNNVAVMNFDSMFKDIKEKGLVIKGTRYTLDYMGGLVSADGVHPTMLGHGVLANEMIKTLNTHFSTGISPIVLNTIAENEQLSGAALTPPASIKAEKFEKASKVFNGESIE